MIGDDSLKLRYQEMTGPKRVEAIVDGGMIGGNPGKGGWGGRFRIYDENENVIDEKFFGFSFGKEIVTNNVAEWRAIIGAMQIFAEYYYRFTEFEIISDSKIAVKQATGYWECKDSHLARLKFIFDQIDNGMRNRFLGAEITITHKRREHTTCAHDHIAEILGRI